MSVIAETPHAAIGPCCARAEASLALYAWTAVFRSAALVNTVPALNSRTTP